MENSLYCLTVSISYSTSHKEGRKNLSKKLVDEFWILCRLFHRSKQLIKDAINENDFLKNLESAQVREVVDCMYPKTYNKSEIIVQEGDIGHALYVIAGKIHLSSLSC